MTTSRFTAAAGCTALVAATLAGCAAVPPTMGEWKPAPVGTSWATAQRNTGSFGKDMETSTTRMPDREWKGLQAVVLKTTAGFLLQHPKDGRWLALMNAEGRPVVEFDPPAGWTRPIAVGDSWKRTQKMNNLVTGRTAEYESSCTVAAWEKVTVPAGTFDALRVECSSSADAQDTYWTSPAVHPFVKTRLVRGPRNPNGPGTQETELLKLPS